MAIEDSWATATNERVITMFRKWHILPTKSLEVLLWYFWGLSCVFVVPYINVHHVHIRFVELSTFLVFIVFVFRITAKKTTRSKKYITSSFLLIVSLYCLALFWPLGGVITAYSLGYTPQFASYIAPFRRLIIVLILLGTYVNLKHDKWLLRERALIQGFLVGCIVTVAWMIIEQVVYLFSRISLNDLVFRELLGLNPEHTFVNLVSPGYTGLSMPLYRATGFGWDPGPTALLVVLGWLLYNLMPESLVGKRRLSVSIFLLLALPLSLSRTAIIGAAMISLAFLGTHVIVSIAKAFLTGTCQLRALRESMFTSYWRSVFLGLITIAILVSITCIPAKISVLSVFDGLMSFIEAAFDGKTVGDQRHLTYITLVPSALTLSWASAFLGYGTANTGIAIEQVGQTAMIGELAAKWQGNWIPESTTVNFALMGGMVSLFALVFCLTTSITKVIIPYLRNPCNVQLLGYVTILLVPFILGLGYAFENTIIYMVIFLIFLHIWDPEMR